jgi:hypothetical protein
MKSGESGSWASSFSSPSSPEPTWEEGRWILPTEETNATISVP